MSTNLDVLFINPGNSKAIYQDLANDYVAIETPTWSLLLAQSVRSVGYKTEIFDVNAERLSTTQAVQRIKKTKTRLLCFVVYGQNPNSGTVNMSGATDLAKAIKEEGITTQICFVGSHVSALPLEVLKNESCVDLVLCNEGVYALRNLLKTDIYDTEGLAKIKGIGYKKNGIPVLTSPEQVVPQERMDIDLPGYAWDLLPYDRKPLDLYRAHFWHAEYDHEKRTPFAAIYTSLGCTFRCDFCMINIVNRNDNSPIGIAGNYSKMRFWSPDFIIKEFDKLVEMGVKTLRISDEMFLLNKKYYVPLCEKIIDRGYGEILSMWAYSRIDTVRDPKQLELIRKAGIKWLALGIESGEKTIRLEASKGKFEDVDIQDVVKKVHDANIEIIANYLFGLQGDTFESMQKTLDLSLELCTIAWNAYAVMALPGSKLYKDALDKGFELPEDYAGYAFLSYDTKPLPTEQLSPEEILQFRDAAFTKYHTHKPFLEKVHSKYGETAANNINDMTQIKLKRKILGD
jgi:anaerobic magnesium-protoporphyrin IX monomethyl ester cyclase